MVSCRVTVCAIQGQDDKGLSWGGYPSTFHPSNGAYCSGGLAWPKWRLRWSWSSSHSRFQSLLRGVATSFPWSYVSIPFLFRYASVWHQAIFCNNSIWALFSKQGANVLQHSSCSGNAGRDVASKHFVDGFLPRVPSIFFGRSGLLLGKDL